MANDKKSNDGEGLFFILIVVVLLVVGLKKLNINFVFDVSLVAIIFGFVAFGLCVYFLKTKRKFQFLITLLVIFISGIIGGICFYFNGFEPIKKGLDYLGWRAFAQDIWFDNFWKILTSFNFEFYWTYLVLPILVWTPIVFFSMCVLTILVMTISILIKGNKVNAKKELLRNKKQVKINNDKLLQKANIINSDGFILGADMYSSNTYYTIAEKFLSRHTCLIGTTGSGKTITLYNFVYDALQKNKPIIYITAKYDQEDIKKFTELCNSFKRKSRVFSLNGDNRYNPFVNSTPTEIVDKIIGMFDFSDDYYKSSSTRFLQLLVSLMQELNIAITLHNIVDYSSLNGFNLTKEEASKNIKTDFSLDDDDIFKVSELKETAQKPINDNAMTMYKRLKEMDKKSYSGFINRLSVLVEGDLKNIFKETEFNIDYAIANNEAVIFSLDSLAYQEQARQFGRLLVNDLKPAISHHQQRGSKPVGLFFDEFNVFVSHEIVDVINKSRSAGIQALIAFQSLADIDKIDPNLTRQIIQNCNSLIVHAQNEAKDAETLANTFGTFETIEKTYSEALEDNKSANASVRKVREFTVHPDEIKRLKTGECFIKTPLYDQIHKIKVVFR